MGRWGAGWKVGPGGMGCEVNGGMMSMGRWRMKLCGNGGIGKPILILLTMNDMALRCGMGKLKQTAFRNEVFALGFAGYTYVYISI